MTTALKIVSVGPGTMGPGVAVDYLVAGHNVTIAGRNSDKLTAARQKAYTALEFLASENVLSAEQHTAARANLTTTLLTDRETLAAADIIVESITEDVNVKQEFFGELEKFCRPDALFLSNTSGLSITDIFAKLEHPERGMGTHYWNPPYLMPLVEVTPGERSDPALYEKVCTLLESMGKQPVRVRREYPGLIWNRLQFALFRECLHLLQEGVATAAEIDAVVEKGLARRSSFSGLFRISDLGGSDVWYTIASYLFPLLSTTDAPPAVWREQIERGELGLKSGKGFYNWDDPAAARDLIKARDKYLLGKLHEDKKKG
jgi:3-hydroxybutyryl-CoA dehydrogenase